MTSNSTSDRRIQRAIDLKNAGRFGEAASLLEEMLREPLEPRTAAQVGYLLGALRFHRLQDLSAAEAAFRYAIARNPLHEGASVGLFHALCRQKRGREAVEEMTRLVRLRHSPEYARLLQGILQDEEASDEQRAELKAFFRGQESVDHSGFLVELATAISAGSSEE